MKNILVINSFANKIILNKLQEIIPQAEYLFLDKEYTDYKIDVKKEQARLIKADVIVFSFHFSGIRCRLFCINIRKMFLNTDFRTARKVKR